METNQQQAKSTAFWQLSGPYIMIGLIMAIFLTLVGRHGNLYFGADFQFHYNRMFEFYQNIRHGNLFPTISTYSANQVGSNVISMYPPLPAYIGACLMFIFNGVMAMYALIWLQFMAQFVVSKYVALQIGLNRFESTVVAVIFTTATPLVSQSIQQWLLGEVWAMSFMPLVILGLYRLTKFDFIANSSFNFKQTMRLTWPLVVGMTAIIYSHVLSFVIVLVYMIIYLVLLLIFQPGRVKVLLNLVIAGSWTMILSAAFIFPFLQATLKNKVNSPGAYPTLGRWASPRILDMAYEALRFHTNTIGLMAIIAGIIGLFLFKSMSKTMKIFFVSAILVTLSGTQLIWKHLYFTPLGTIQFPHRVFVIAIFLFSVLFVVEIKKWFKTEASQKKVYLSVMIFSVLFMAASTQLFWLHGVQKNSIDINYTPTPERTVVMPPVGTFHVTAKSIDNLTKYWISYGAGDYLPQRTNVSNDLLLHKVENGGQSKFVTVQSQPNGMSYKGDFVSGKAILPLVTYAGNYKVTDQNGHALKQSITADKQLEVTVADDTTAIRVVRQHSSLEIASIILSILSFIITFGYLAFWLKQ